MAASKGAYLRNKMYNAALKNTAFTGAATLYMSVHTAAPGLLGANEVPSTNAYARTAIAYTVPTAGAGSNSGVVTFPAPTPANWGTLTHFGVWDTAAPVAGTGNVTIAGGAGAATFASSQAGVLANDMTITVAGVQYLVTAFNGTTGCTLAGAPNQGPVAFIINGNYYEGDALSNSVATSIGVPVAFPIGNVTSAET